MYGYVRPVKGELKIREYELFRGVYCGLCHELARRYGPVSRFLVNYDFTFLAMLLAGAEEGKCCSRRCVAHPIRPVRCLGPCDSLSTAADMTVILGWWKLADSADDSRGIQAAGWKAACAMLKRAYKKAAARRPGFTGAVRENLQALRSLERENCSSVDETADKFALILRSIAQGEADAARRRTLEQLLYHLGRIIYILDAVDDLAEDERTGAYNPLRFRFAPEQGKLSPEDERTLRTGLQMSHNALAGAFALLAENPYSGILSNTVYLGLPAAAQAVFSGVWRAPARLHKDRSSL